MRDRQFNKRYRFAYKTRMRKKFKMMDKDTEIDL